MDIADQLTLVSFRCSSDENLPLRASGLATAGDEQVDMTPTENGALTIEFYSCKVECKKTNVAVHWMQKNKLAL